MDERHNFDLNLLSLENRQMLQFRLHLVTACEREIWQARQQGIAAKEAIAGFIAQLRQAGIGVSGRTLYCWRRAWRNDGLLGLVDRRWIRGRAMPKASEFLACVRRLYLLPAMHSMQLCHLLAQQEAARHGWPVCTLRETQRFIRERVLPSITRERPIRANQGGTP